MREGKSTIPTEILPFPESWRVVNAWLLLGEQRCRTYTNDNPLATCTFLLKREDGRIGKVTHVNPTCTGGSKELIGSSAGASGKPQLAYLTFSELIAFNFSKILLFLT
jgi:hypothetical protein